MPCIKGVATRSAGPGRVAFNVVFTPANADIAATRAWLAARIGDDDVALDTEGVVTVYDDGTLHGPGAWTEQDYRTLHDSIVRGFETGDALRYGSIRDKARDFVHALKRQRPATALGQKCGMDEPDRLAVDLLGNVMTCQNTGARGRHHLGHVAQMHDVQLDTATHWSHRETCSHCPVVQLCKGGCMYLDGEHFAQSCESEYRYNLAILEGLLYRLGKQRGKTVLRRVPEPDATWLDLVVVDNGAGGAVPSAGRAGIASFRLLRTRNGLVDDLLQPRAGRAGRRRPFGPGGGHPAG